MEKLRAIFMGTPDFAVPCLEKLQACCDVRLVVTQPDKKRGRGQKVSFSPVKKCAMEHGLPVFQPTRVKEAEAVKTLREVEPDIIVVVAFGQILSQEVLDIPRLGCVNVHASLLPSYRGAAPIHWSIIHGEKKTGVTTMYMDAGLDTGDMIFKAETEITLEMTTQQLHDILMHDGALLLEKTVLAIAEGTAPREKQDDAKSSYSPLLHDADCRIDWTQSAQQIHDRVRGLNSWPGAYTLLAGEKYKIWQTRVFEGTAQPGQIVSIKEGIAVGTGQGLLEIVELQPPNKRRMKAKDFINGHKLQLPLSFS